MKAAEFKNTPLGSFRHNRKRRFVESSGKASRHAFVP